MAAKRLYTGFRQSGCLAEREEGDTMKAGFHTADITPALGMEAPGGYGKVYIQQVHDPLKVRAAVFENGETTVAFVGIDTCYLQSARVIRAIRQEVERRCGIPADHLRLA